jgi:hypothetical protein
MIADSLLPVNDGAAPAVGHGPHRVQKVARAETPNAYAMRPAQVDAGKNWSG